MNVSRKRQAVADLALVGVAFVWGATFVTVKDIVEQTTPMLFVAARFCLGALALAFFVTLTRRWRGLSMREVRWGALIGVVLGIGYILQTLGLYGPQRTSVSNAGFITGLSVVLVPVLGLFILKQMPMKWAWAGVAMATTGLAMLSLRLDQGLKEGDAYVLGGAVAFAMQIVLVARVAASTDPLRMTLVQVAVAGLLSGAGAMAFEKPVAGLSAEIWAGAAFLGLVATALAFVIQMTVQRFTTAVHTALIFTLEPVFAAIFGYWLHNDRLGAMGWAGAALILCGMLVAELGPQFGYFKNRRARVQVIPGVQQMPVVQARIDGPTPDAN